MQQQEAQCVMGKKVDGHNHSLRWTDLHGATHGRTEPQSAMDVLPKLHGPTEAPAAMHTCISVEKQKLH